MRYSQALRRLLLLLAVVVVATASLGGVAALGRERSTNVWWVRATGTNHNIELAPPEGNPPIVVEAIRQVVLALRAGGTLPACASSPIVAAGGECLTP